MSATIWKAVLRTTDVQSVEVPAGAEILCAREQGGDVCIWFRCDPAERGKRRALIAICGTGHPAPSALDARYLGTAFIDGGAFVFHVFERIATPPQSEDAA